MLYQAKQKQIFAFEKQMMKRIFIFTYKNRTEIIWTRGIPVDNFTFIHQWRTFSCYTVFNTMARCLIHVLSNLCHIYIL